MDVSQNARFVAHPFSSLFHPEHQEYAHNMEKVRCFGYAKASPRHLGGAFVGTFQLSVSYAVIFSDARV